MSSVIVRVRLVVRKTVGVDDRRFDYLSGSHLQSQVKSLRQMMVFMPLVVVLIGQFCLFTGIETTATEPSHSSSPSLKEQVAESNVPVWGPRHVIIIAVVAVLVIAPIVCILSYSYCRKKMLSKTNQEEAHIRPATEDNISPSLTLMPLDGLYETEDESERYVKCPWE